MSEEVTMIVQKIAIIDMSGSTLHRVTFNLYFAARHLYLHHYTDVPPGD